MTLAGKVAVVTGASRGIGSAISERLAAEGVKLGLVSRSGDDLGIADAVAVPCDVRSREQLETAVARTLEAFGAIDILVANAGVGAYGLFEAIDPAVMEELIDINVRGLMNTVSVVLPHLLARKSADIVTVASDAGLHGLPNQAVYCASKFAQVGFTRALDNEVRERGVRCTNVCPGGVATDFAIGRGRTLDMPERRGMLEAQDVAELVLFVLTRPRGHRIMDVAFRAMAERSWG